MSIISLNLSPSLSDQACSRGFFYQSIHHYTSHAPPATRRPPTAPLFGPRVVGVWSRLELVLVLASKVRTVVHSSLWTERYARRAACLGVFHLLQNIQQVRSSIGYRQRLAHRNTLRLAPGCSPIIKLVDLATSRGYTGTSWLGPQMALLKQPPRRYRHPAAYSATASTKYQMRREYAHPSAGTRYTPLCTEYAVRQCT